MKLAASEINMDAGIVSFIKDIYPAKRYERARHGAAKDIENIFSILSGIDAIIPGIIASCCSKMHQYE